MLVIDEVQNLIAGTYREQRRIGIREMAKIIGTSHATLSRIERGLPCDSNTAYRVMLWVFQPKDQSNGNQ